MLYHTRCSVAQVEQHDWIGCMHCTVPYCSSYDPPAVSLTIHVSHTRQGLFTYHLVGTVPQQHTQVVGLVGGKRKLAYTQTHLARPLWFGLWRGGCAEEGAPCTPPCTPSFGTPCSFLLPTVRWWDFGGGERELYRDGKVCGPTNLAPPSYSFVLAHLSRDGEEGGRACARLQSINPRTLGPFGLHWLCCLVLPASLPGAGVGAGVVSLDWRTTCLRLSSTCAS